MVIGAENFLVNVVTIDLFLAKDQFTMSKGSYMAVMT